MSEAELRLADMSNPPSRSKGAERTPVFSPRPLLYIGITYHYFPRSWKIVVGVFRNKREHISHKSLPYLDATVLRYGNEGVFYKTQIQEN